MTVDAPEESRSGEVRAVVLFDIDLTLLDSGGAGREAMNRAFRELYAVDDAMADAEFAGRTDYDIVAEALARYAPVGGDPSAAVADVREVYGRHLADVLPTRQGRLMPGVRPTLERLSAVPGVRLGLATGNFALGARLKLQRYGLDDLLSVGGFGDDHADRAHMVASAATAVLGYEPADGAVPVLVVGDTPRDIAAAAANGFRAIGVATGGHSTEELAASGADLALPSLEQVDAAVEAFLRTAGLADGGPGIEPQDPYPLVEETRMAIELAHAGSAEGSDGAEGPPGAAVAPQVGSREREVKFSVDSVSALDTLYRMDGLPGGYPLTAGGLALLTDAYYDTPDYALLRHGYVLRLRHADGRTKITVKGLERSGAGAVHDRLELEGEAASGSPLYPATWPQAMRELTSPILGPAPELVPVCFLEHARHLRTVGRGASGIAGDDGEAPATLGELGVEKVTVMAPDRMGRRHGAPELVSTFAEVELEVESDVSDHELGALAAALGEVEGLRPSSDSKLERALHTIAAHPIDYPTNIEGVQPEMPMSEAGRLIWRQQHAEMLLNEAGARKGEDIEFVHDMRVASRRARAALDIFGSYFRKSDLGALRDGLKRTGGALGAVRDLDVALDKLARFQRKLPDQEARDLDILAARWHEARADAYEELLAWLDSRRYARFVADFGLFCQAPGAGAVVFDRNGSDPHQVRHVMPLAIVERFGAVRAHEIILTGETRPKEEDLHALRIDCKRLRYSLEAVRHLLGEEGEALIGQLKALQDHLGDLNDAAVTRDRLREMQRSGLDHRATERYIGVQEETVERLRDTFDGVWLPFIAHPNRRLLMEAVARL